MTAKRLRLLVIEHESDAGLGRLTRPLERAADLDVITPHRGTAIPSSLDGYAGLIVLGGSMACWESEKAPWLPATGDLLAQAVRLGRPALGICLGAQLLAAATGGQVQRGAAGPEIGAVQVQPLPAASQDPLMGHPNLRDGFAALAWHGDAITTLPPDATLLGTGTQYPHQAFRVGQRAWGVQYHPEVSPRDWRDWVSTYRKELTRAGHDEAQASALVDGAVAGEHPGENSDQPWGPVALAHAQAFAAVVEGVPA